MACCEAYGCEPWSPDAARRGSREPAQRASARPDPETLARIRKELGDVTLYLVRLADVLGVDLMAAAHAKLEDNDRRYDAERYRGSAKKAPPSER
ncbi:hypothetical protein [Nonomuraea sp. NPDC049309]|uniref:hypothetical protein n=1 Tax=Nonomuraea sp. NPDC049309 TaxID=3364350 RepID=UPI003717FFA4